VLTEGYRSIAQALREKRPITPAAEWLIDNFHIVEEQIREIIDDLPPGYYRELPKLAEDHLAGYPAFLAWPGRLSPIPTVVLTRNGCGRFVRAYQKSHPLLIGEVWALAISLRIVLVENLRRMTERIVLSKLARQEADALADRLLGVKGEGPMDISIEDPFKGEALPRAFAVQLVQRLRDKEGRAAPALQWLDQRLSAQGTTAEDIVRLEHQEQAAMNTTGPQRHHQHASFNGHGLGAVL